MFPVTLCLERASCLVVGGGEVALRKVAGLLREAAVVTVVSPEAAPELHELAESGRLKLELRRYRSGEARGYRLVFAATDQRDVNREVRDDAAGAGIWVNVADDPELCTFHLPARLDRGPLQLALSSGGAAPFLVRRLREVLERWFPPEWAGWAAAAARFRELVRASGVAGERREALFDRFFAATVDRRRLAVRTPAEPEMSAWIAGTGDGAAVEVAPGLVSLVGAGPGNGGLLTLRGYRRLLAADAVVYDRLAEAALPPELPPHVELHCVGKEAGRHPVPQEEINELLVTLARAGRRVVRLKGGDPYVFGRGGEEVTALRVAGLRFEVIPGVTAGVAGASWAGVPVTHRGIATSVTLFTGHQRGNGDPPDRDAPAPGGGVTLVGYMGVGSLAAVTAEIAERGVAGATPAMLIERATTAAQRSVKATLETLAEAAERAQVRPPALIVVGETVALAELLDWSSSLPLAGRRLVIPGPDGPLAEALELAGAEVLEVPVPLSAAAQIAVAALPISGWFARTAGTAESLCRDLGGRDGATSAVAWCFGDDVAAAARRHGWPVVRRLLPGSDPRAVVRAIGEG